MKHVIIFGITGGVGNAIAGEFLKQHDAICIYAPSRSLVTTNAFNLTSSQQIIPMDWNSDDESSLMAIGQSIKNDGVSIDYCISALGGLHSDTFKPEKKLGQLSADQMMWYYHVNTVLHALIIKTMAPLMAKKSPSIMGFLSARVGSIGDNKLGGWYSYRASKAALNMIIKTAAIEMARYNKQLAIIGLHPGTVDTNLSKPFQAHVPEHKLFTPQQSSTYLFDNVLTKIGPSDSGYVFAYDGERLPE